MKTVFNRIVCLLTGHKKHTIYGDVDYVYRYNWCVPQATKPVQLVALHRCSRCGDAFITITSK